MRFALEVANKFIGQATAVNNLALLAEEILDGTPYNVALIAPSGCGKTLLSHLFLEFLDPGFTNTLSYDVTKDEFELSSNKRFHFIDEVHNLSTPEKIYSFMNSPEHIVVIATNEYDKLKEPLINRCEIIQFLPYTLDEIGLIIHLVFKERDFSYLPFKFARMIAEYSRGTPRIAKRLANRICGYFKYVKIPKTKDDLDNMLEKTLGILEGGFTRLDNLYLDTLRKNEGVASLSLLSSSTGIPAKYIQTDIEPFLISRGMINISSKGRILKSKGGTK